MTEPSTLPSSVILSLKEYNRLKKFEEAVIERKDLRFYDYSTTISFASADETYDLYQKIVASEKMFREKCWEQTREIEKLKEDIQQLSPINQVKKTWPF